jgi:vancomycin permeability regulator SanA
VKLSEINNANLTDKQIEKIVFSDINDSGKSAKYGIVFGSYTLQKYRIEQAIKLYKEGRVEKLILTGGKGGISNKNNEDVPEAELMKASLVKNGISPQHLILDNSSNSTIENGINVAKILNNLHENIQEVILISSEFHLKRCMAIMKKYYKTNIDYILVPAKDGFTDKENWFLSEKAYNSGRNLVEFEANLLIKYAKEGKIYDLNI